MSVNGELVGAEQTANNRVHEKSAARHIAQILALRILSLSQLLHVTHI